MKSAYNTSRLEAIAIRLETIPSWLEAIASRLDRQHWSQMSGCPGFLQKLGQAQGLFLAGLGESSQSSSFGWVTWIASLRLVCFQLTGEEGHFALTRGTLTLPWSTEAWTKCWCSKSPA